MEPLFPRNDQLQSRSSRRADSRLDEVNNLMGWLGSDEFSSPSSRCRFEVTGSWQKFMEKNWVIRKTESSEGQVINQPLRKSLNV